MHSDTIFVEHAKRLCIALNAAFSSAVSFDSIFPPNYDPNEVTYDHYVDLDVSVEYQFSFEHPFPTLHVNISRSFYECDTRYFIDFVEPVTPLIVSSQLGLPTTSCSNYNRSYEVQNWGLGLTKWIELVENNFTLSPMDFEYSLRTGCGHPSAVRESQEEVTFMQQQFTKYDFSWSVYVCQISILDSTCSSQVSQGIVAKTCKAPFPATLSIIPSIVTCRCRRPKAYRSRLPTFS